MINLLFICTGNVSRSFLAENLCRYEAQKAGLDSVSISSAGLFTYPGSGADSKMADFLLALGASFGSHSSKQMSDQDAEWADVILVMEKMHAERIEELWPYIMPKVLLLSCFLAEDQKADDIVDPFGRASYYYRSAQSQITLAVRNLVQQIQFLLLDDITGEEMLQRLRGEK